MEGFLEMTANAIQHVRSLPRRLEREGVAREAFTKAMPLARANSRATLNATRPASTFLPVSWFKIRVPLGFQRIADLCDFIGVSMSFPQLSLY